MFHPTWFHRSQTQGYGWGVGLKERRAWESPAWGVANARVGWTQCLADPVHRQQLSGPKAERTEVRCVHLTGSPERVHHYQRSGSSNPTGKHGPDTVTTVAQRAKVSVVNAHATNCYAVGGGNVHTRSSGKTTRHVPVRAKCPGCRYRSDAEPAQRERLPKVVHRITPVGKGITSPTSRNQRTPASCPPVCGERHGSNHKPVSCWSASTLLKRHQNGLAE